MLLDSSHTVKMKNQNLVSVGIMCLLLSACGGGTNSDSATPATTPTDGSQSAAQLAGSGQICSVQGSVGTVFTGKGVTRVLTLGSSGTYTYNVYFTDNVGCSTAQNAGGNNIATLSQSGTFTLSGIANPPGSATKVTFTSSTNTLTVYSGSDAGSFATWLNGCTPNPGFNTGGTSTHSVSGLTCTNNASYALANPPTNTLSTKTILGLSGTTMNSGPRTDVWSPGQVAFPAAFTETYLSWH
jgi:hypothetical protein